MENPIACPWDQPLHRCTWWSSQLSGRLWSSSNTHSLANTNRKPSERPYNVVRPWQVAAAIESWCSNDFVVVIQTKLSYSCPSDVTETRGYILENYRIYLTCSSLSKWGFRLCLAWHVTNLPGLVEGPSQHCILQRWRGPVGFFSMANNYG